MARNRRNVRRIKGIKDVITNKTFLIIVSILLVIIFASIGINIYRRYKAQEVMAREREELNKQTEEMFASLNNKIELTNKNISEADSIIKMSAVGDILCSDAMIADAYNTEKNTYDFSHMFGNVSDYIDDADIIMGTMETGIVSSEFNDKRAPIEFAKAVKASGVNLVTISHNHSLDNGLEGLKETKENLQELGFDVVGDKFEDSNAVVIKEAKGSKIAFLTYTCLMDNKEQRTSEELNCVNMYSEEQVKSDIKYAKEEGANFICVMIHWGDAISSNVNDEQKQIAQFLVDNDVDIIIGAHPSVMQEMEVVQNEEGKNVFIAYSIGTYISTLSAEETRTELVLNIQLARSGKSGEIYLTKVDYTKLNMVDNGENAEDRFVLKAGN